MKTKWILPTVLALTMGATALGVTGCDKPENAPNSQAKQYTCPMKEHADVVKDKPGDCPKCGMRLVEKK